MTTTHRADLATLRVGDVVEERADRSRRALVVSVGEQGATLSSPDGAEYTYSALGLSYFDVVDHCSCGRTPNDHDDRRCHHLCCVEVAP